MEKPEQKIKNYLTDIKELPMDEEKRKTHEDAKFSKPEPKLSKDEVNKKPEKEIERQHFKVKETEKDKSKEIDFVDSNKGKELRPLFSYKDITLGVINFVLLVILIILLTKLPQKSLESKNLRAQEIINQTNPTSEYADVPDAQKKVDDMKKLFLNETGIVDFVNQVEALKTTNPVIQKVTFASQKAIADKTGNFGIPVIVQLSGGWQDIGSALEKIQSLHFLFRAVNLDIQHSKDDPNVVIFNYGVILYVNDELGQSR